MASFPCAAVSSSPTVLSDFQALFPRATQPPTPCSVNEVIIQLSTRVLIADYDRYFAPTPIASFLPNYVTAGDGSLIAKPFMADMEDAKISLLVTGILTMLFARNILVSGDYLRRAKAKNKALFYLLFASQLLAPACFVPDIVSYFKSSLNCTVALSVSRIASSVSLSILITGILGYKAYRCLENSRIVFAALALFLCASTAMTIVDLQRLKGTRRISGGCTRVNGLIFMKIYVVIQCVEMLFILSCFIHAICKLRRFPTTRGRISVELSVSDGHSNHKPDTSRSGPLPARRGWWDYVPEEETAIPPHGKASFAQETKGIWNIFLNVFTGRKKAEFLSPSPSEKCSPTEGPHPPSGSPLDKIAEPSLRRDPKSDNHGPSGRNSPAPSSFSRLSKFMPRMALLRAVVKDELYYTALITSTCFIIAILAVIGINFKNGLTVNGWILANWGLISTLAIHSLGRVIQRHEKETMRNHPSVWNSAAVVCNHSQRQRRRSPMSVVSHRWRSPASAIQKSDEDPFADTHQLRHSQVAWGQADIFNAVPKPRSPSPTPSADSFTKDPLQAFRPSILLSLPEDFPTSGRTTPVVRHDSSDGTLIQALHTSPTVSWVEAPPGQIEGAESVEKFLRMNDVI